MTMRLVSKASLFIALSFVLGCGGGTGTGGNGDAILIGETQRVNGFVARTEATRVNGKITEVVTRVPFQLIQNPPTTGAGPAGAFLSLEYPQAVKNTTFLDHFELHWNPEGHPPSIFMVPHFDVHAYGIAEAAVFDIAPPDTVAPDANRLPPGYIYPGTGEAVPQMGVHAVNPADLEGDFDEVMIHGYWGGEMIFVEPMITQARLLSKQNIELAIGKPEVLGEATRYPTRFRSEFDLFTNSYLFIFDQFEDMSG